MFDALQPGVPVRLLSGELLLENMPPNYLIYRLWMSSRRGASPTLALKELDYSTMTTSTMPGKQDWCKLCLHGQTHLVVVLSSFKYVGLTDDQVVSMREEHFDYLQQKTAELKLSFCFWCNADTYNGDPIQHTRYDCRPEDVDCFQSSSLQINTGDLLGYNLRE